MVCRVTYGWNISHSRTRGIYGYPRMLALAEVAWSAPERKSWPDFHTRALSAVADLQKKDTILSVESKRNRQPSESAIDPAILALGKK